MIRIGFLDCGGFDKKFNSLCEIHSKQSFADGIRSIFLSCGALPISDDRYRLTYICRFRFVDKWFLMQCRAIESKIGNSCHSFVMMSAILSFGIHVEQGQRHSPKKSLFEMVDYRQSSQAKRRKTRKSMSVCQSAFIDKTLWYNERTHLIKEDCRFTLRYIILWAGRVGILETLSTVIHRCILQAANVRLGMLCTVVCLHVVPEAQDGSLQSRETELKHYFLHSSVKFSSRSRES